VRKNGKLERLQVAGGEVLAYIGPEAGESADGGLGSEAALENTTNAVALEIHVVGVVDLLGGEHASEGKEAVVGVLEQGWDIIAVVDQALELPTGQLGTWK